MNGEAIQPSAAAHGSIPPPQERAAESVGRPGVVAQGPGCDVGCPNGAWLRLAAGGGGKRARQKEQCAGPHDAHASGVRGFCTNPHAQQQTGACQRTACQCCCAPRRRTALCRARALLLLVTTAYRPTQKLGRTDRTPQIAKHRAAATSGFWKLHLKQSLHNGLLKKGTV